MSSHTPIQNRGLRATAPRLKILDIFQSSLQRHLSAEEVFQILQKENFDIGLATVYRVLVQFEQAGLLLRHHFGFGHAVYELNQDEHHDHLVCLDCGRVEEFFDDSIEKRQQSIAQSRGFTLKAHALSLYACCTLTDCPHRQSVTIPE